MVRKEWILEREQGVRDYAADRGTAGAVILIYIFPLFFAAIRGKVSMATQYWSVSASTVRANDTWCIWSIDNSPPHPNSLH